MPGLPIEPLPGYAHVPKSASGYGYVEALGGWNESSTMKDEATGQNYFVRRTGGTRTLGNLATGQDEQVPWSKVTEMRPVQEDAPLAGPLPLSQEQHGKLTEMINQQFDTMGQTIRSTITNDSRTEGIKTHIKQQAIEEAKLDPEQKAAKLSALKTEHALHMAELEGKIQPDLADLEAKRQQALLQAQLNHFETTARIEEIEQLVNQGLISPEQGLREQYKHLGITLPAPARPQTPRQRLAEIRPVYNELQEMNDQYRLDPATGKWQKYDGSRPKGQEWVSMTPADYRDLIDIRQQLSMLRPQLAELRRTVIGGRGVADLRSAVDTPTPIGRGVVKAREPQANSDPLGLGL